MKRSTRTFFPALTALMMVFWLSACAGESHADSEGGEAFESFTAHPEMSPCG